ASSDTRDGVLNPLLAPGVEAVGTPTAVLVEGETHLFVRGTNRSIYWMNSEDRGWQSIGCCAGSDIAAVESSPGQIEIAFVGASSGRTLHSTYRSGRWSSWRYVANAPANRGTHDGYLAPALVSRAARTFDLFAVNSSGGLSVASFDGGWGGWTDLQPDQALISGPGWGARYRVPFRITARPAAIALNRDTIQLALVVGTRLFEPRVSFAGGRVQPEFTVGSRTGEVQADSAPALTTRANLSNPYRVVAVGPSGRLMHRFANGAWFEIGGIPADGTGVSAVATGRYNADLVILGTPMMSCVANCESDARAPNTQLQSGGIWLRSL
ncbi:MAG: hypothetical protein KC561_09790, partial [Myxococcales bacterium]|nr:hypothetical protein [Myxococcales bacterium]